MKNTKLTDKTDNYRILSVYIDNIMRKTENHEQQTRLVLDCYTIVIVRSGKIHIEESGQQMILSLTSAGSWRTKRWQTGTTRCSTSSVSRWSVMPGWRSWRRTSSVMRIGGLRCLRKTKMTNSLTMFKLETMIYASEDGTNSVFTLNSALQKQLDALATQHPEVCQRKARGEAGGVTYQVRGAALAIQPVRGIDLLW